MQRGGDNSGAALARARLYVALNFVLLLVIFMSIFATAQNYPVARTAIFVSGAKTQLKNKNFSSLSFLTWKFWWRKALAFCRTLQRDLAT